MKLRNFLEVMLNTNYTLCEVVNDVQYLIKSYEAGYSSYIKTKEYWNRDISYFYLDKSDNDIVIVLEEN